MTFRVLVTDDLSNEAVGLLKAKSDFDFDVVKGLSPEGLAERISGYDGLNLRRAAGSYAEILAERSIASASGAFSDIGWDRYGRSSKLRCQTESFIRRKPVGQLIDSHQESAAVFPNSKPLVIMHP